MKEINPAKIAAFSTARRAAWRPFLMIVFAVVVIIALTALLAAGDIGLVANTMIVTLCLFPSLILILPLFVGVITGIWALAGVDKSAVERLLKAEETAGEAKVKAQAAGLSVGQRLIALASSVERLEPVWRIFEPNVKAKGNGDAAQPTKSNQPAES